MSHAEIWQKNEKKGTVKAQLCPWGTLPSMFQEGWRPAWLQQVCEKKVGGGGVREVRGKGDGRLGRN